MNETIRLFVAAAVPASLKASLLQQAGSYQHESIRFVPEQNLHLTLYFIGNTAPDALPAIKEKLQQLASRHTSFSLQLQCLEPGPKPRAPRLIWARFEPNQQFEKLSQDITLQLSVQPPKQQKAIPHITLARFRKDKALPDHLPAILPAAPVSFAVDAVSLWQSTLSSPHPIYSILETFPLS
ncbi:RNA 2',3'-cyclic phosphodiesterase [Pontibacter sp. 13R65]|uniref:RNA 2',3'-cyclic phosphodiesterase n=1 Tax=Pontibacter sp. 13R65 TaxID=3127458 RepID=UPI00301B84B4